MPNPIVENSPMTDHPMSDRDYVRIVARKMLRRLEHSLDAHHNDAELKSHHEGVFGAKSTPANVLVMLAELLLKLEKTSSFDVQVESSAMELPLAQSDIALMEAFVGKIRHISVS